MTTDANLGGHYYPQNSIVRIAFAELVGDTAYPYIDLPMPSTRVLHPNKQVVKKPVASHRVRTYDLGFMPTLDLAYEAPSDSVIGKLCIIANFPDDVTVFPFFGLGAEDFNFCYRMKLVEITPDPFGGDKNFQHTFTLKFESTKLYKMYDPDSMYLVQRARITSEGNWIRVFSRVTTNNNLIIQYTQ